MSSIQWRRRPAGSLASEPETQAVWDGLNARSGNLPFMSARAMAAALDVFGRGDEQLLVGERDGQPMAMFLLTPEAGFRWTTFQPSQLPLGAWVAEPQLDLPATCRSLIRGPLGLCLALSVTQVDARFTARQADESDTWHQDYIETAWLDIQGGFDDYWSQRGKNLRQNMRKQRNKLATEGIATELRVHRGTEDMAAALERYGALESAGWKSRQGTAIDAENDQGRFYKRLLEEAARAGEAMVFEYLLGGRCAAMNLCLLRDGVLVVLKTTYDESLPKTLSPAFLLREDELKFIHAAGEIRRIEYYGRVMDWHTKLTDERRGLYHLTTYRWPVIKAAADWRRRRRETGPMVDEAVASPVQES